MQSSRGRSREGKRPCLYVTLHSGVDALSSACTAEASVDVVVALVVEEVDEEECAHERGSLLRTGMRWKVDGEGVCVCEGLLFQTAPVLVYLAHLRAVRIRHREGLGAARAAFPGGAILLDELRRTLVRMIWERKID
jgi:hypothetical protein